MKVVCCLGPLLLPVLLVGAGSSQPPLVEAARSGDVHTLRMLLREKAGVNAAEGDGTTALHWASYHNDLESAELLIRADANVNAANDLGATSLWLASQNGSTTMVRLLLEAGANPNAKLLSGETPLMVAARSGYPEVVELLAAKGSDVNCRATRGQTALMWAVSEKHPEVVKVLLAHGADVRARSETWSDVMAVPPHGELEYNMAVPHGSDTALLFAARVGDLDSAKLLVTAGADVNDKDAWGVTATVLAAHSGFTEMVEFFLDKGSDPNLTEAGFTALQEAIMRRDEKMAAALLAHGADPNAPLRTWTPTRRSSADFHFEPALVGATPFWLAARFTEPNIMRMLAEHGADPRFVHHSDYVSEQRMQHRKETATAVMAALGMGGNASAWVPVPRSEREKLVLESVKLAADLGADLNVANTDRRTALDAAKSQRYESVVKFLEERGAKPGKGGTAENDGPGKDSGRRPR
jgi:ankyrin repeat protein